MPTATRRGPTATPGGDRGAGLVASVAGVTVFLLFLLFAVQVLIGLYATSTVRAALHDAASRAAVGPAGVAGDPRAVSGELARLAGEAEASLGEMGDRTQITLQLVDDDGDGSADAVAGTAVAVPPRLIPPSVGGMVGFEEVRASVRVRVERFR